MLQRLHAEKIPSDHHRSGQILQVGHPPVCSTHTKKAQQGAKKKPTHPNFEVRGSAKIRSAHTPSGAQGPGHSRHKPSWAANVEWQFSGFRAPQGTWASRIFEHPSITRKFGCVVFCSPLCCYYCCFATDCTTLGAGYLQRDNSSIRLIHGGRMVPDHCARWRATKVEVDPVADLTVHLTDAFAKVRPGEAPALFWDEGSHAFARPSEHLERCSLKMGSS